MVRQFTKHAKYGTIKKAALKHKKRHQWEVTYRVTTVNEHSEKQIDSK